MTYLTNLSSDILCVLVWQTYKSYSHMLKTRKPAEMYLWWGLRNFTSRGSTIIKDSSFWSLASSGCHNTKGSISGGSDSLSSGSFSTVMGVLKLFVMWTRTGLVEPHGTNRLRAESRRANCSLFSEYPKEEGGLKGFLMVASEPTTE